MSVCIHEEMAAVEKWVDEGNPNCQVLLDIQIADQEASSVELDLSLLAVP